MPKRREMPPDFPKYARNSTRDLAVRFGCCHSMVTRWRRQLGIVIPPGAPKGNGNSVGNQSRRKATHGMDGIEAVRTCLSCTRPRCSGSCTKVR